MDFELTEEQRMLKENVRKFIEKEVTPAAAEKDHLGVLPKEEQKAWIKRLLPFGYLVGPVPEEHGGQGLGWFDYALMMEELAYGWAALSSIVWITSTPTLMLQLGPPEFKERYLKGTLSGDLIGALCLSEPNVGSQFPRGIQTRAVAKDDAYVLNGRKIWISNGYVADFVIVYCMAKEQDGSEMPTFLLVDKAESPFEAREIPKIGWKASSLAELTFEDVLVPRRNNLILSAIEEGSPLALAPQAITQTFAVGRAMLAIRSCGVAQAAIDASVRYAKERIQFGKPLGEMQIIQEMIVDMTTSNDAARLLALRAFDLLQKGKPCMKEAAMAKAFACENAIQVTLKAMQVHGAMGLTEELPLERYFRDARVFVIPDGTTQIQKLIAGREILGLKAFR